MISSVLPAVGVGGGEEGSQSVEIRGWWIGWDVWGRCVGSFVFCCAAFDEEIELRFYFISTCGFN